MNKMNNSLFMMEHKHNSIVLLNRLKNYTIFLLIVILLPLFVYLVFNFNLVESKNRINSNLEQPVALVNTNSGTGTAFLVGNTRLLTAKHVVENVKVGETVQLVFEKATPPISTEAKLIWKNPNILQAVTY